METTRILYTALTRLGVALAPLVARGDGKLAASVRARSDALDHLVSWGRASRDPSRPLVWMHAPSVGEGLQARAVLERLRGQLGPEGAQWVFTHFSPSAEGLASRMPVDVAGYLPWDLAADQRRLLEALRPSVIVFTKTEVWPNLVAEAARGDIPCVLTAATLPETSSRRSGPARWFLRSSWRRLAEVHAIAEPDARGFVELGARPEVVEVTGDPGIDSAAERVRGADPSAPWLAPFLAESSPTLVAGSTWPADEAVLVPAATAVRDRGRSLRLVVAPHEPTPAHLVPLELRLSEAGWRTVRLSEVESAGRLDGADAVVVDRVGVLAELYRVGRVAWVGGGFGTDGLHSVLEPAAAGCPVLVGPNHRSSSAALDLLRTGGVVSRSDVASMSEVLDRWLSDDTAHAESAAAATRYIDAHSGAADACATRIGALLSGTAQR